VLSSTLKKNTERVSNSNSLEVLSSATKKNAVAVAGFFNSILFQKPPAYGGSLSQDDVIDQSEQEQDADVGDNLNSIPKVFTFGSPVKVAPAPMENVNSANRGMISSLKSSSGEGGKGSGADALSSNGDSGALSSNGAGALSYIGASTLSSLIPSSSTSFSSSLSMLSASAATFSSDGRGASSSMLSTSAAPSSSSSSMPSSHAASLISTSSFSSSSSSSTTPSSLSLSPTVSSLLSSSSSSSSSSSTAPLSLLSIDQSSLVNTRNDRNGNELSILPIRTLENECVDKNDDIFIQSNKEEVGNIISKERNDHRSSILSIQSTGIDTTTSNASTLTLPTGRGSIGSESNSSGISLYGNSVGGEASRYSPLSAFPSRHASLGADSSGIVNAAAASLRFTVSTNTNTSDITSGVALTERRKSSNYASGSTIVTRTKRSSVEHPMESIAETETGGGSGGEGHLISVIDQIDARDKIRNDEEMEVYTIDTGQVPRVGFNSNSSTSTTGIRDGLNSNLLSSSSSAKSSSSSSSASTSTTGIRNGLNSNLSTSAPNMLSSSSSAAAAAAAESSSISTTTRMIDSLPHLRDDLKTNVSTTTTTTTTSSPSLSSTTTSATRVIGSLPPPLPPPPIKMQPLSSTGATVAFALDMLVETRKIRKETGLPVHIRIGIHVGKVIGGVIGTTRPRYLIWGEDTLIGNKMESTGIVDSIQVSEIAALRLQQEGFEFVPHQVVDVSYKGDDNAVRALGNKWQGEESDGEGRDGGGDGEGREGGGGAGSELVNTYRLVSFTDAAGEVFRVDQLS